MYPLVSHFNSGNVRYGQDSRKSEMKCAGCRQCRHRFVHDVSEVESSPDMEITMDDWPNIFKLQFCCPFILKKSLTISNISFFSSSSINISISQKCSFDTHWRHCISSCVEKIYCPAGTSWEDLRRQSTASLDTSLIVWFVPILWDNQDFHLFKNTPIFSQQAFCIVTSNESEMRNKRRVWRLGFLFSTTYPLGFP